MHTYTSIHTQADLSASIHKYKTFRKCRSAVAWAWTKSLKPLLDGACGCTIGVMKLMKFCVTNMVATSLWLQVLWHAAKFIELSLAETSKNQCVQSDCQFHMKWTEPEDHTDNHLQQRLVRYFHSCQAAAAGEHIFGINTDKGSGVGGQSLQSTVVFLRNGTGLFMPPQAHLLFILL